MKPRMFRRLRFWSQLVVAAGTLLALFLAVLRPWVAETFRATEYKRLVVECDQAMHDEVAIRSGEYPGEKAASMRRSADVQLLVCHQYDVLRKDLLVAGVSEERLARLGLEALESERITVDRMVDPHRMPRF
jgi:hypothetical protein